MTKKQPTDWETKWIARRKFYAERENDTKEYYEKLVNPILPFLKEAGVTLAECDFYGCGDSGDYEGFYLFTDTKASRAWEQNKEIECLIPCDTEITVRRIEFNEETKQCEYKYEGLKVWRKTFRHDEEKDPTEVDVRIALETVLDYILDDANVDWYNNEGGGGKFRVHLTEDGCQIYLKIYQNIVSENICVDIGEFHPGGEK